MKLFPWKPEMEMSHLSLPTSLLWYPECYEVSMSGWQAFPGASRHSTRGRPVSRVRLWEESQTGPWRGAVASSRPARAYFGTLCLFPFPALERKANGRANLGERKAFLILPRPSSHPLLASTCLVQPSRPVFFLASFPSLLSHFLPNYLNLICLPTLLMGFVFFILLCVKSKLVFFFSNKHFNN